MYVSPKSDCEHIKKENLITLEEFKKLDFKSQCHNCEEKQENWICLECGQFYCSRYVSGHMAEHNESTKHGICLSMMDLSFWCYDCDSYIVSPVLNSYNI
jgi:uncharacterized UBP type Zn finger protein